MITLKDLVIELNSDKLFSINKFQLGPDDRVGLLAPNGTGKSVFMRQLASKEIPHSLSVAYCAQQLDTKTRELSLNEWVLDANESFDFNEFFKITQFLELPLDQPIKNLSGGQEKKASLAYTLCQHAEVYLLDEPTNHLDVPSILWLESFLLEKKAGYFIISHDLTFLEKIVQGYWAVHEGYLKFYPGQYEQYQQIREQEEITLANEHTKKQIALKQEERYRERGVTARRKRNQKRVEKLHQLRAELKNNNQGAQSSFSLMNQGDGIKLQKIIELKNFQPSYFDEGKPTLLPALNRIIHRQEKIAIVGGNGRGKTTLLKQLLSDSPNIEHRDQLKIAYLDQNRLLPENETPFSLVAADSQHVTLTIDGKLVQLHPITYLARFGLSSDKASTPFGKLSGGEKMKVALAKALAYPVDVLVLDEPTNDLDIEAIEELSELILNFNGLVLLVSHDRHLINECATQTWYLTPERLVMHAGGFDESYVDKLKSSSKDQDNKKIIKTTPLKQLKKVDSDSLLKKIEEQEEKLELLHQKMVDPIFYQPDQKEALNKLKFEQKKIEEKIAILYQQWNNLENS